MLEDAARIDGCSRFRILWSIVLPVSGGAIATLAIFTFLFFWNDFTWPYIVVNAADVMTLPVALIQFKGDYFSEYGQLMAGAAISAAPTMLIFLVAQKMIIRSITLTGLKGKSHSCPRRLSPFGRRSQLVLARSSDWRRGPAGCTPRSVGSPDPDCADARNVAALTCPTGSLTRSPRRRTSL